MGSADSLVDELLTQVVNPAPGFGYLALSAGEPVCLVVNGLGGTTPMELAIACRRAVAALERADGMAVRVTRVLVGTFMSSLDMAGLSLSVLKLDEQRAARLDAPTAAPAWPANGCVRVAGKQPVGAPPAVRAQHALRGARADPALLHAALRRVCEQLIACAAQLNAWDQLVGDGDCGDTLRAGAERVLASLEQLRSEGMLDDSAAALAALGESAQAMGGSSGALYNIGLTAAARAAAAAAAEPEARMWASALTAAAAAISDVGGARPGYRCAPRRRAPAHPRSAPRVRNARLAHARIHLAPAPRLAVQDDAGCAHAGCRRAARGARRRAPCAGGLVGVCGRRGGRGRGDQGDARQRGSGRVRARGQATGRARPRRDGCRRVASRLARSAVRRRSGSSLSRLQSAANHALAQRLTSAGNAATAGSRKREGGKLPQRPPSG